MKANLIGITAIFICLLLLISGCSTSNKFIKRVNGEHAAMQDIDGNMIYLIQDREYYTTSVKTIRSREVSKEEWGK